MHTRQLLALEELFFPEQVVRANSEHDPAGVKNGTRVNIRFRIHRLDDREARWGAGLEVTVDEAASDNPPYWFSLDLYAIFRWLGETAQPLDEVWLQQQIHPVLEGAVRERLLDLTSRAPWGRFLLDVSVLQAQHSQQQGE